MAASKSSSRKAPGAKASPRKTSTKAAPVKKGSKKMGPTTAIVPPDQSE